MPYSSPLFGKLQRCACLEAAQVAAREAAAAARTAALTAQLDAELGRLRRCTFETFDPHRSLPGDVVWQGGRDPAPRVYSPQEQRKSLLRAYSLARQYEPVESLYLWGSFGSGKSHLAAAILNALATQGVEGRYGSAPALLRLIQKGFGDGSAHERLEALMAAPILVIDDLGTESQSRSGWNESTLFDLVNTRYLADRPTIFTSNDPVEAHADSRLISRINGTAQIVELITYDHRMLGQADEAVA